MPLVGLGCKEEEIHKTGPTGSGCVNSHHPFVPISRSTVDTLDATATATSVLWGQRDTTFRTASCAKKAPCFIIAPSVGDASRGGVKTGIHWLTRRPAGQAVWCWGSKCWQIPIQIFQERHSFPLSAWVAMAPRSDSFVFCHTTRGRWVSRNPDRDGSVPSAKGAIMQISGKLG